MKYIYTIIIAVISLLGYGQDSHLSQFDAIGVTLNPGQTGMYKDADFKAGTQYRNQWGALSSKYATSVIAYDMPLNSRWGVGGYIVNDDETQTYNVFKFVVGGAYQIMEENNKHMLSVGLHAGIIYKNIKESELLFDNQWNDGNFDSDKSSGENIENLYKIMPEVNLGIYYKGINENQKINPYAGLAFYHVTNPRESFLGAKDSRLPLRYQLNVGAKYKIDDKLTLDPGIFGQYQRNIYEINAGLRAYYIINELVKVNAGAYYRINDAAIILLGISYKNVDFNMSYDINTSSLKQYTNGKGAFEFSIIFRGIRKKHNYTLLD